MSQQSAVIGGVTVVRADPSGVGCRAVCVHLSPSGPVWCRVSSRLCPPLSVCVHSDTEATEAGGPSREVR